MFEKFVRGTAESYGSLALPLLCLSAALKNLNSRSFKAHC